MHMFSSQGNPHCLQQQTTHQEGNKCLPESHHIRFSFPYDAKMGLYNISADCLTIIGSIGDSVNQPGAGMLPPAAPSVY